MSVELVTGYYGVGGGGEPNRHVSSAEDGARQAGTVGLGCYVLSTGSKLSATMEDANTLVVADGDVVMNGRHVSMPDATSFTIPTGVQGQKVSNLAVLRYEKAADSVESVTPVVLTGEPSADEPTDPTYNEGSILDGDSPVDFPLYRVVTDGINAGDPVPLFDILVPMSELKGDLDELRDSVSQNDADIGSLATSVSRKLDASRVLVGSKVISLSTMPGAGQWVAYDNLLTASELRSMLGRNFNGAADAVAVWNGDWNAANVLAVPFARTSTTSAGGNVGVYLTSVVDWPGSGRPGSVRVGYMVVRGN